ncbi:MAG: single-stranded DNA-binding protein [Candidatus Liptonbacteria bacterium]|nr:single-stranded DNA-binding protein [Candidatus Liptonbacteria bacterium]
MNLNKVFLIGRLTRDPELRSIPSGQSVASFGLATNRTWTDKAGARQESVEFHNVVVWGRQAETVSQFLTKGALAMVEGRLQTRSWQNKEGQNMKTTEIVAERIQFGPRAANAGAQGGKQGVGAAGGKEDAAADLPTIDIDEGNDIKAEDLPF